MHTVQLVVIVLIIDLSKMIILHTLKISLLYHHLILVILLRKLLILLTVLTIHHLQLNVNLNWLDIHNLILIIYPIELISIINLLFLLENEPLLLRNQLSKPDLKLF